MFTAPELTAAELHKPPVRGCKCTYCKNTVLYGFGVRGHGSLPSHRLVGGKEAHNPENLARLVLKERVPADAFARYVKKPGGETLLFKGPSGLWYGSGRGRDTLPGHFVHCFRDKGRYELAWLCLPPKDEALPLATIVLTHYLYLTLDELGAWKMAPISYVKPAENLPLPFREIHKYDSGHHRQFKQRGR